MKKNTKNNNQSTHNNSIFSRISKLWLLAIPLALLTFAIYIPALKNEFLVNWDEDIYILDNLHIRSMGLDFFKWALLDYKTNLWHPLTWISHALDYAIWGLNPFGHHLTSIFLHAVNTGIIVFLAARIINLVYEKDGAADSGNVCDRPFVLLACAVTALLFGIHPLHVESVVWITERKDLLYSMFYMLSIIWYIRHAKSAEAGYTPHLFFLNRPYQISLLLFFLSLSSKPMAVTLPAILLLLDWYPLRRLEERKSINLLVIEKLPFFVLSAVVSVVTIIAQQEIGGMKTIQEASPIFRLLLAMKSLMLYLFSMIAPINLLPLYPYPKETSIFKVEYALAVLFVVAITTLCVVFRKNRSALAVWLFFVISLLPVLGLLQAGVQAMADRFLYLPLIGPFLLAGVGISFLWDKAGALGEQCKLTRAGIVALVIICAVSLSWLTCRQIGVWKNAVVLWSYLIEKDYGKDPGLYVNRASALERTGQFEKSLENYAKALELEPKNDRAYFNRGTHYLKRNMYEQAIGDFSMVIKLKPDDADSYSNRGNANLRKGDVELAIQDMTMAINKKPGFIAYYINRGSAFAARGQFDKAVDDFTSALSIKPDAMDILVARGSQNMKAGRFEQGMQDFNKACTRGFEEGCRKAMFPF